MVTIILYILIFIANILSFSVVYAMLNNVQLKIDIKMIIVIGLGAILFALAKMYFVYANHILTLFYFPIIFYLIMPNKISKIMGQTILIWLVGMAIDLIMIAVLDLVNLVTNINLIKWDGIVIVTSLLMCFFLIIFFRFSKGLVKVKFYLINIPKSRGYDIALIILTIIFLIFGILLLLSSIYEFNRIIITCIIIIILSVIVVFCITSRIYLKNVYYNNMKIFKENTDFYNEVKTEYDVFRHNLVNKLNVLKTVANEQTIILIDELIGTVGHNCDVDIVNVPYELSGIISQKFYEAKDLIVNVDNLFERDLLDALKAKSYSSFVECIGVLLDNAIEAALKSNDKLINICFYETDEDFAVDITNTFDSGVMDIDNLGTIHYSTKGSKRGLGLFSVLRNNNISVEYNIVNNLFIAKIRVKK